MHSCHSDMEIFASKLYCLEISEVYSNALSRRWDGTMQDFTKRCDVWGEVMHDRPIHVNGCSFDITINSTTLSCIFEGPGPWFRELVLSFYRSSVSQRATRRMRKDYGSMPYVLIKINKYPEFLRFMYNFLKVLKSAINKSTT